jgi:Maltokinase N-terminal cap domain
MAVIHHTTLTPGKLELLAAWLPAQPWYARAEPRAQLAKAGGFRLDDPEGEVGIEFMVVSDGYGDHVSTYHVPLSYRGAPLDGADSALIGTTEHGVLGRRWVYDGAHDPVLVGQLLALIQGAAEPQAQSISDTPDPSVTSHFIGAPESVAVGPATVINGPHGTDLKMERAAGAALDAASPPELTIRVTRVLKPLAQPPDYPGYVTATWRSSDGTEVRGLFAALLFATLLRPDGIERA